MKKLSFKVLCAVMASVLVVCCALCGCGGETATTPTGGAQGAASAANYEFSYNGTEIKMNAPAADIIAKLGEPLSYFEAESCAFEGIDKTYTYQSFIVTTYPKDGADYISSVRLTNDTVNTPEGVCIGSTMDSVNTAYKTSFAQGATGGDIKGGNCTLSFVFDAASGNVTSIKYNANI